MDKLNEKLISIERALGGEPVIPQTDDVLGWHLDYIESLIEEGGGGSGGEGVKVVDFGTIDEDISNPDQPYVTSITQEKYEEAVEADVAQFTTDDGTYKGYKSMELSGMGAIFTSLESEHRQLSIVVMNQDSSYMLMVGMTNRFLERGEGGTQLYKHSVECEVSFGGEETIQGTIEIINLDENEFEDVSSMLSSVATSFISGKFFADVDGHTGIFSITYFMQSTDSNSISMYCMLPDNMTLELSENTVVTFTSDTVTSI